MVATNAKNGFNYESYMSSLLKRMKRSDPEMFNMIDGPHLLGIVGFEKEWIFNIGSVFSVERVYERFNYKYIEGTIT
jgi:hypothetical protein